MLIFFLVGLPIYQPRSFKISLSLEGKFYLKIEKSFKETFLFEGVPKVQKLCHDDYCRYLVKRSNLSENVKSFGLRQ